MSPAWALNAGAGDGSASPTPLSPPSEGLILWLKGDAGVNATGNTVNSWEDQSGFGQDFTATPGFEPETNLATIDGVPCVSFRDTIGGGSAELVRTGGILDRDGNQMGYGVGETQSITVMAVFRVVETLFNVHGGPIFMRGGDTSPPFEALFDLEGGAPLGPNTFWLWSRGWRNGAESNQGPNTPPATYDNLVTMGQWYSPAFPTIATRVNNANVALTPATMSGIIAGAATPIAMIGDVNLGGTGLALGGDLVELLVWDYDLLTASTANDRAVAYLRSRFPSIP